VRYKAGPFFVAAVALTACVSNSNIHSIGDGHYRAAAHASDSSKAEMRALFASYAYCEKLKLGTVFDDFRRSETINEGGSGVIVSMTFQCEAVPDLCAGENVYCTEPQPLLPHK
jgi:hypothetical protein